MVEKLFTSVTPTRILNPTLDNIYVLLVLANVEFKNQWSEGECVEVLLVNFYNYLVERLNVAIECPCRQRKRVPVQSNREKVQQFYASNRHYRSLHHNRDSDAYAARNAQNSAYTHDKPEDGFFLIISFNYNRAMTYDNISIWPPIWRCHFVSYPTSQRLWWLRTDVVYRFGQIVYAVQHHLGRVCGSIVLLHSVLPNVYNIRSAEIRKITCYSWRRMLMNNINSPNGNVFGYFVPVPVLSGPENLTTIGALDDRTTPCVLC